VSDIDTWAFMRSECERLGVPLNLRLLLEATRAEAIQPVVDLCDRWDVLSRGPTVTTRQIREVIRLGPPSGG
jgi:hypothetical protein